MSDRCTCPDSALGYLRRRFPEWFGHLFPCPYSYNRKAL